MKLGIKNILKILRGSIVPPPEEIESINDRMWKYYREEKWATVGGRFASKEHCHGLSMQMPYYYHDRIVGDTCIPWKVQTSHHTYSSLTVHFTNYGGDSHFLLNSPSVPEFIKEIIKIYHDNGWASAVPIPGDKMAQSIAFARACDEYPDWEIIFDYVERDDVYDGWNVYFKVDMWGSGRIMQSHWLVTYHQDGSPYCELICG